MSFLHDAKLFFRFPLHCDIDEVSLFLKEVRTMLSERRMSGLIGVIGGYSLLCHLKKDEECSARCVYGLNGCFINKDGFIVSAMVPLLQAAGIRFICCESNEEIHLSMQCGVDVAVDVTKGSLRAKGEELSRSMDRRELSRIVFMISTLGYRSADDAWTDAINELTSCLQHQPVELLLSADALERGEAMAAGHAVSWTIADPQRAVGDLSALLQ